MYCDECSDFSFSVVFWSWAVAAVILPGALDPEAELGRLIEPMLPPLLLLEKPLEEEEEEDLPPSTESSSSKFLSVGDTSNTDQRFKYFLYILSLVGSLNNLFFELRSHCIPNRMFLRPCFRMVTQTYQMVTQLSSWFILSGRVNEEHHRKHSLPEHKRKDYIYFSQYLHGSTFP